MSTTTAPPKRFLGDAVIAWLATPVHSARIEIVRIAAPLAILGFLSSRIAHADEWLGDAGFRVPDLGRADYRQPLHLPTLPNGAAWALVVVLVASGLAVSAGLRARRAALVFAATTAWVALADRLAAFSVSKLAPVVAIALATSACGARWSVDAWLARRASAKSEEAHEEKTASGAVRFFQVLLPVIYCASGIAKAKGDWLKHSHVLWTHLHDSYQTAVTVFLANLMPAFAWTVMQAITLAFEAFALLWFGWAKTRGAAVLWAVSMHAMIGLMFGPVRWFAMLMATLVVAAFLSDERLDHLDRWVAKLAAKVSGRASRPSKKRSRNRARRRSDRPSS